MSNANLSLASKTLQNIKANPALLEEIDVTLTRLRHRLGQDLNDATFNYVVNSLLNQRVQDGVDRLEKIDSVSKLPGGYRILAAVTVEGR